MLLLLVIVRRPALLITYKVPSAQKAVEPLLSKLTLRSARAVDPGCLPAFVADQQGCCRQADGQRTSVSGVLVGQEP
jgi:hypothetical protein